MAIVPKSTGCSPEGARLGALLGDRHNFGRGVVRIDDHWIHKPRPLFWEHLFLDKRSQLRQLFDIHQLGKFLPNLWIDLEFGFFHDGLVESLKIEKIRADDFELFPELAESLGELVAICLWFGIGDIHCENLIIGQSLSQVILAPVDIEIALKRMSCPAETILVPLHMKPTHHTGFSNVNPAFDFGQSIARLINSYIQTFKKLERIRFELGAVLTEYQKSGDLYSRVLFRPTYKYLSFLKGNGAQTFEEFEIEQLLRNDVPYFFRNVKDRTVLQLTEDKKYKAVDYRGGFPDFENRFRLLDEVQQMPNKSELEKWIKHGSFQLISYFLGAKLLSQGSSRFDDIAINWDQGNVLLRCGNLQLKSNLERSLNEQPSNSLR